MAETPIRKFRASDELWEAAQREAEHRGETVSAAIVRFLHDYTDPSGIGENSHQQLAEDH